MILFIISPHNIPKNIFNILRMNMLFLSTSQCFSHRAGLSQLVEAHQALGGAAESQLVREVVAGLRRHYHLVCSSQQACPPPSLQSEAAVM